MNRLGVVGRRLPVLLVLLSTLLIVFSFWVLFELLVARVRTELISGLEQATGASVTISGAIHLTLEPAITANAADLQLTWDDGGRIDVRSLAAEVSAIGLGDTRSGVGPLHLSGVIVVLPPSMPANTGFGRLGALSGLPDVDIVDLIVRRAGPGSAQWSRIQVPRVRLETQGKSTALVVTADTPIGRVDANLDLGGTGEAGRPLVVRAAVAGRQFLMAKGDWQESRQTLACDLRLTLDQAHSGGLAVTEWLQRLGLPSAGAGFERLDLWANLKADPEHLRLDKILAAAAGGRQRASISGHLASDYENFNGSLLRLVLSGQGAPPFMPQSQGLLGDLADWEISAMAGRESGRWNLTAVDLVANGNHRLAISARGSGIIYDRSNSGRPAMALSGQLWWRANAAPKVVAGWQGLLSPASRYVGRAGWRLAERSLQLERLAVTATGPAGATAAIEGDLKLGLDAHEFDLTARLRDWPIGGSPGEGGSVLPAPMRARGRVGLAGHKDAIRVSDVELELRAAAAGQWRVGGTIERLDLQGQQPFSGADLKVEFDLPEWELGALNPILGRSGRTHGGFRLFGSEDALAMRDVSLHSRVPGAIEFHAEGEIARFNLKNPLHSEGVDLDLIATVPDVSALTEDLGGEIPVSGPLRAVAKLQGSAARLQATGFDANLRLGGRPLNLSGRITNLAGDKAPAADLALRLDPVAGSASPRRGAILGEANFTFIDGGIRVDQARIHANEPLGGAIHLKGWLLRPGATRSLDLKLQTQGLAGNWWLNPWGLQPPLKGPWSGSVRYARDAGRSWFSGKLAISRTEAAFDLVQGGGAEQVAGTVRISELQLADLGLFPRASRWRGPTKAAADTQLFSNEAIEPDWWDGVPLDLDLSIERLVGRDTVVQGIRGKLYRDAQEVAVTDAVAAWKGGRIRFAARSNRRTAVPRWILAVNAQGVEVDSLLSQWWQVSPLSGTLDLVAQLQTEGDSAHRMAENSEGELQLMVGHGAFRDGDIDILSGDAIDWMFAEKGATAQTALNCLVGRFEIKKGIAASRMLAFETDVSVAQGKGFLDFGKERLELKFRPKPKREKLAALSSLFKISGSMAGPEVTVAKTAGLKLAGNMILSPVNALGELFTDSAGDRERFGHVCGQKRKVLPQPVVETRPSGEQVRAGDKD